MTTWPGFEESLFDSDSDNDNEEVKVRPAIPTRHERGAVRFWLLLWPGTLFVLLGAIVPAVSILLTWVYLAVAYGGRNTWAGRRAHQAHVQEEDPRQVITGYQATVRATAVVAWPLLLTGVTGFAGRSYILGPLPVTIPVISTGVDLIMMFLGVIATLWIALELLEGPKPRGVIQAELGFFLPYIVWGAFVLLTGRHYVGIVGLISLYFWYGMISDPHGRLQHAVLGTTDANAQGPPDRAAHSLVVSGR